MHKTATMFLACTLAFFQCKSKGADKKDDAPKAAGRCQALAERFVKCLGKPGDKSQQIEAFKRKCEKKPDPKLSAPLKKAWVEAQQKARGCLKAADCPAFEKCMRAADREHKKKILAIFGPDKHLISRGTPKPRAPGPNPFPGFNPETVLPRLQGTWGVPKSNLGPGRTRPTAAGDAYTIWDIKGTDLTFFDGATTRGYTLEIISPCTIRLKDPKTGRTARFRTFVFDGDALYLGTEAGFKKGNTTVVCAFYEVFVLKDNKCTNFRHDPIAGKWKKLPATCRMRQWAGKPVFEAGSTRIRDHGKILFGSTWEKAPKKAKKFKSMAEAKAALKK
jgi:hypothetical protein